MIQTTYTEARLAPGLRLLMGKEKAWWRVLEVNREEKTAILIADNAICYKAYHDELEAITWEKCTLRRWLNEEYYEKTFTDEEKAAILEVDITNPDNLEYKTKGGNNTKDKIWLLSLDEVKTYFKDAADRAIYVWWWLRSPGINQRYAAIVDGIAVIIGSGSDVCSEPAVRPAFKINLQSSLFQSLISDSDNLLIKVPNLHIVDSKLISIRRGQAAITIP